MDMPSGFFFSASNRRMAALCASDLCFFAARLSTRCCWTADAVGLICFLFGLGFVGAEDDDADLAAELTASLQKLEADLEKLEVAALLSGEYDDNDAVVTLHAGAGGTESQDWAEMLLRMYLRWAEREGYKVELDEVQPGEEAGIKSSTFIVHGESAYGFLSAERGVHRLVRISPFDAAKRRHTSFASLDVIPLLDEAKLDAIRGEQQGIDFGSQIRSYVLAPYQMVKDHRTEEEVGDPDRVLDGDLTGFMEAELRRQASLRTEDSQQA